MANSRSSGSYHEYATVDTAPSGLELGYWTNAVSLREKAKTHKIDKMFFSIREQEADSSEASDTSVATVVLQFRCSDDAGWQDFNYNDDTALKAGDRVIIEDMGAGVSWRAGIKDGGYTSGSMTFGFDW